MTLGSILKSPPVLWLAPSSGVQFLDFGFRIAGARELPQVWSFADDPAADAPRIVGRGDDDVTTSVSYEVDWRSVMETFDGTWVPLPFFRREPGGHDKGPINWARGYVRALDESDADGNDVRIVLAFDTALSDENTDRSYLAPTTQDSQRGGEFTLAAAEAELGWFAGQSWVKAWCRQAFLEMALAEERARSNAEPEIDDAQLTERMEGPREDVARYMALVDMMRALRLFPGIQFIDQTTQPAPTPIDVDLVLDLGNSRTCGLIVETHPDEASADVTQAVKLDLRDLSRPEFVYADPFDSRIEFNQAKFGWDDISILSGRADAFGWPTVTRVGDEASRLSANRRGSEGKTGMSSPKRYLWDMEPRNDSWRFNSPNPRDHAAFATGAEFTTLVNDAGEPLHAIPASDTLAGDRRFPAMRALYARSHLMTFALAEIFLHAQVMMNAPSHRLRRGAADLPRRLRRIIMTMPTGMPLAERQILVKRAEAARDLIQICLGAAEVDDAPDAPAPVKPTADGQPLPEIMIQWDEASATQAAYLYAQVASNYAGDARAFFKRMRQPLRPDGADADEAFRLATLDIGGGTSDLAITAYAVDGQGANVTLYPKPLLREGIPVAGDDIVRQVIVEHVVERIRQGLEEAGLGERADYLVDQLFGGDRGDMHISEQVRRQKFAANIGHPIALAMIGAYERWERLGGDAIAEPIAIADVAPAGAADALIDELDAEIAKHGAVDFTLRDLHFPVDLKDIDRTVRSVMKDVLDAFAELVNRMGADMLILSGRPSRMPALFDLIAESSALPPNRILPLHRFRVGQWYPFRDFEAKIADPKTTAAVGAMICLMGEGRLRDFNYRADFLKPQSTARYFGKLDRDNRLAEEDVYVSDMQLDDPDYELPEAPFEFRGPMALGARQFAADWWPATRLYSIDYASPEAAAKLNAVTPLKVQLKRASGRGRKGVVDAFDISRIVDVNDRNVPTRELKLWLQTIDQTDGFWLDTGVLTRG